MHKLDRASTASPMCLSNYCHSVHNWDAVTAQDKQAIRTSLEQLQGNRCAYCESAVYSDSHIEHFRRKNILHFPELTFEWSNLFLSCNSQKHCGHYKDRPSVTPYDPASLVKPDDDDPDAFFYFHSSGEVRARSGLSSVQQIRSDETIRVFNLNCSALQEARRRALRAYERREPKILEALMGFSPKDREAFINDEIRATADDPHCTVIRHFFEKVS